eukprot:TRINITY_DN63451_c1_g1_i2.p2 TRINITY_DN63451_c1_g1~~TRINITY_DN63451_c1_g1_i2.p2  ORF type:complete len:161 (+),score=50.51 TRINITY_DN63451_c1_g1_i2:308-790(+)
MKRLGAVQFPASLLMNYQQQAKGGSDGATAPTTTSSGGGRSGGSGPGVIGVFSAVIDQFLLSEGHVFVGNPFSSFSGAICDMRRARNPPAYCLNLPPPFKPCLSYPDMLVTARNKYSQLQKQQRDQQQQSNTTVGDSSASPHSAVVNPKPKKKKKHSKHK